MQHRRHLVNGRLVERVPVLGLDPGRCLVVLSVCLALWFTNPANHLISASSETRFLSSHLGSTFAGVTNYGFFSIFHHGDRISLNVATLQADCPLLPTPPNSALYPSFTGSPSGRNGWYQDLLREACTQVRDCMAHEKPLLWAPRDYPHTLHRILSLWLVLGAILASCCRATTACHVLLDTGNLVIDAALTILVPDPHYPLQGLFWSLFQANLYLYPVWQVMSEVVPLQQDMSWFHVVDHPVGANVAISALCLVVLAITVNAGSKHWMGSYLLVGLDGLVATGFGYYRAMYGNQARPELQWWRDLLFLRRAATWVPDVSATSLTWFLIVQVFSRQSLPGVAAFCVANMAGYCMGDYQKTNLSTLASFGKLLQELQQGITSMFYQ